MDAITVATHAWAAARVGTNADNVRAVYFDSDGGEGCPTCGLGPEANATVVLHHGGLRIIDLDGVSVVDVIREITALVKAPSPVDLGGDYCECCDPDVKWCKHR